MSHTIPCIVARPSNPAGSVDERGRSLRGIETILAFTDFTPHAAAATRRAAQLADQHRASLRLVHVIEPPLLAGGQGWIDSPDARSRVASAEAELATHARSLNSHGKTVGAQVLVGPVVEEILGLADHANLLVLGARGASAVKSALLGSTATRLLTRCTRPMLVVKRDEPNPYGRILVPIDLRDDATTTLHATEALAPCAEVHVLHAYQVEHEGGLRRAGVDRETLQRNRRSARARMQARLHAVLARAEQGTHRYLPHLRREHPVRLILTTETRFRADLIVMSKRSRSKIEDALLGSTTKRVLLDSRADVLVVPLLRARSATGARGARA